MRYLHIGIDRISSFILPHSWLIVIIVFLFVCCKHGDNLLQEQLYGRWQIAKAERNGKETSYLRGGYFIIDRNGTMTVNITGADEKGTYMMNNTKLVMGDKNFELRVIRDDSMIVKYVTGPKVQFIFYMQKKHADVQ